MNNEDTEKLRAVIDDMRSRSKAMYDEAYKLIEKAKTLSAESYTVENKFVHLLFPDE